MELVPGISSMHFLIDKGEGREVTVVVTDEMSAMDIGKMLNERGLIDERPLAFWIQEFLSEYHNKILPGSYILKTSQTVDEMLPILAQEDTEGQPSTMNEGASGSSPESSGSQGGGEKP